MNAGASTETKSPGAGADGSPGEIVLFWTHFTSAASKTSKDSGRVGNCVYVYNAIYESEERSGQELYT